MAELSWRSVEVVVESGTFGGIQEETSDSDTPADFFKRVPDFGGSGEGNTLGVGSWLSQPTVCDGPRRGTGGGGRIGSGDGGGRAAVIEWRAIDPESTPRPHDLRVVLIGSVRQGWHRWPAPQLGWAWGDACPGSGRHSPASDNQGMRCENQIWQATHRTCLYQVVLH